jgi:hypothetical protein
MTQTLYAHMNKKQTNKQTNKKQDHRKPGNSSCPFFGFQPQTQHRTQARDCPTLAGIWPFLNLETILKNGAASFIES